MSIDYNLEELQKQWDDGPWFYVDYKNDPDKKDYYWKNSGKEIHFKNSCQKAIWILIQGQLSDGHWENRDVDWSFWMELKPIVDGTIGWKTKGVYVPRGEWPVYIFELDKDILLDIKETLQKYFKINDYTNETFETDIQEVMDSMGTSLRTIGYID
jgi:hypothetical protein